MKRRKALAYLMAMVLSILFIIPSVDAQNVNQQVLARVKETLTVNGKVFKDLNSNGKLDDYENWELSIEKRVADLISKMTLEEKAGLMIIPEFREIEGSKMEQPNNLIDQHARYFVYRSTPSADVIANTNNTLQEKAEGTRLGIPAVLISNPRNHFTMIADITDFKKAKDYYVPTKEGPGQFSIWPDSLGLAATRDLDLVKEFAQIARKEWTSAGLRKMYGYNADIATQPLWARILETFGESPKLVSDINYTLIKGFQGEELDKNSVSLTTKHFPGGGSRYLGKDPHFEEGNFNIYPTPGSLQKYHLPPFIAAIEAGTNSILPYYAYPSNKSADQGLPPYNDKQQFEEVGFVFNKAFITDLLRKKLRFKGYVNSDTGAIIDMAWGAKHMSREERIAKAMEAGANIFSGQKDPQPLINAVNQRLVSEEQINQSVAHLLTEMMTLGLFENPYVNPKTALEVVNNRASQEKADLAHRKSIVLLRNDQNLLPLKNTKIKDMKLYVESFPAGVQNANTIALRKTIQQYDPDITLTNHLEEATHALVWIKPKQDLLSKHPLISIGPDTQIQNKNRIIKIQKTVPTITAINFSNPWLIQEIEPNAAAVIGTFGVKTEALIDVIRGKFNPTGKLPITIPANQNAVVNDKMDVPGFDEAPSYVYQAKSGDKYGFGFGLSYNTEQKEAKSSYIDTFLRNFFNN
ncbi:glycoside hydrolase family 3 C-terminal domain-containing protein [Neobacillus cucumis]|uniref:glycoside hydrolase family 3 protein n=1 Tax=Neobacillus cucumis TaxID=1740721 RepID=UPI00203D5CB7|nr:glycoside hydrolase family 3 N-terminal domain-containing protein [Neobacillus cucumis]MCM3729480.1 glycoside hydrolase family 3 C-terminal domain-containing protein [Neobacillus cucumis]